MLGRRVLVSPFAYLGPVLALVVLAVVDKPGLVEAWGNIFGQLGFQTQVSV